MARVDRAQVGSENETDSADLGRRNLGVLMALVTGGVLGNLFRAKPAMATDGQPLVIGNTQSSSRHTELDITMSPNTGATSGFQISGTVDNNDVLGVAANGASTAYNTAIAGFSTTSGNGIQGQSSFGTAIVGETIAPSGGGYGVYGVSFTDATHNTFGPNIGVVGISGTNNGVFGQATNGGNGVYGYASSASSGAGVYGYGPNTYGVLGQSNVWAGYFIGNVYVTGTLSCGGGKSAVVPHPDGSRRRVYSLESPESLFEDFSVARLENGRGRVALDPDFAAIVNSEAYQVFLTPEGDCKGLFVGEKTAEYFEVRELQEGTSSLNFAYRIVAKRRDIVAPRLEVVELPENPVFPLEAPKKPWFSPPPAGLVRPV